MKCPTADKIRHRDELAAKIALASANNGKGDRRESRAYYCRHCRGWHLTSRA
jgi:hypothetical protein